jgi:hypothetical protein
MPFQVILVIKYPVRVFIASLDPEEPLSRPVFRPFLDPAFYYFHDVDAQPPKDEDPGAFVALAACVGYDVDPFTVHTKAFHYRVTIRKISALL